MSRKRASITSDPPAPRLTLLIADDHALVREGLKLSLKHIDEHAELLEADTLDTAMAVFRSRPDIDLVLLDLSMPGTHSGTALENFIAGCPEARVVVVSATCDMATVQTALRQGVLGFIPKLAGRDSFLHAIRFVLGGGTYVPPEAVLPQHGEPSAAGATALAAPDRQEPAAPMAGRAPAPGSRSIGSRIGKLTARQIDVLAQLLEGKPNKQICRELNLAMGTVKCHVGAILDALEVKTRAEAIAAADERGLRQLLAMQKPRTHEQKPPTREHA